MKDKSAEIMTGVSVGVARALSTQRHTALVSFSHREAFSFEDPLW